MPAAPAPSDSGASPEPPAPPSSTTAPAPAAAPGTAREVLDTLAVKGRAPKTGYDRDRFGPAWQDTDGNGCDTRNDILRRDLVDEVAKPGTRGCVVAAGTLQDPYAPRAIAFTRGEGTSDDVQIDHVVALSDAWQKGAQQLSEQERVAFANDPLNLLAVDGPLNQAKGDSDAATWLPPNRAYRCAYVARQVAVKAKHRLWITTAERDAMAGVLDTCPTEPVPTDTTVPGPAPEGAVPPPPAPAPAEPAPPAPVAPAPAAPAPAPGGGEDPRYPSCKAAKAAGYGPYTRGVDPEYDWYKDGDSDGTNCE
ncbi:excalibur calcium-binding domain-containing protein [Kineococcus xinjiangensis]|uniref:Excalibur calcium-binding domain-containing protein n=1 Tax=Kineococcus xinjiangensis TaxID=512762 RepID=A0A2S6ICN5_9ACTN|nr:DUF1524 domain-containing protein [Kineococcus xinjiangensis]PPK91957.1 excalibur calcium-binding domain-containing protein [Kineococcus xinjiangensis]